MYSAIVIGASAGGLYAITDVLGLLPVDYPLPVIVIQHRANDHGELFEEVLRYRCKITIKQADEKEKIRAGMVYIAPPGYHLLIEDDQTFSLSSDAPVKYSMPSIDVTFESAAAVFKKGLIGIIMTGANDDGAFGIGVIKKYNGLTIAQDPAEAQFSYMPRAAVDTGKVDFIWPLEKIQQFLTELPLKLKA